MFACCILSERSVSGRLFYRYMDVCGSVSFSEMIIAALSSESGLNDRERIKDGVSRYPAAEKCFQKTRYPAVRNFDQKQCLKSLECSKQLPGVFTQSK